MGHLLHNTRNESNQHKSHFSVESNGPCTWGQSINVIFQWWLGWSLFPSRHPILRHFPLFQAWVPTDFKGSFKNGLKQRSYTDFKGSPENTEDISQGKGWRWRVGSSYCFMLNEYHPYPLCIQPKGFSSLCNTFHFDDIITVVHP